MSNNRAFFAMLAVIGCGVYILTSVWDITTGKVWPSVGILVGVGMFIYLCECFADRLPVTNSRRKRLWVWTISIALALISILYSRISYSAPLLRIIDILLFGAVMAMGLVELRQWAKQDPGSEGTDN